MRFSILMGKVGRLASRPPADTPAADPRRGRVAVSYAFEILFVHPQTLDEMYPLSTQLTYFELVFLFEKLFSPISDKHLKSTVQSRTIKMMQPPCEAHRHGHRAPRPRCDTGPAGPQRKEPL